jgi:hypothetical protein
MIFNIIIFLGDNTFSIKYVQENCVPEVIIMAGANMENQIKQVLANSSVQERPIRKKVLSNTANMTLLMVRISRIPVVTVKHLIITLSIFFKTAIAPMRIPPTLK